MSTAAATPCQADVSDTRVERGCPRGKEDLPPGRTASIDTDDFDEFNQRLEGWAAQQHLIGAKTCRSSAFIAMTSSLQVGLVHHAMGYCSQGENPPGTLSIATPLDEARVMMHRGHGVGPLEMALVRSGGGFECLCPSGVRFLAASVAQATVERFAAHLWHEPDLWRHSRDRFRFEDSAKRSRYLDVCWRIQRAVAEQPDLFRDRHATALLEEKFLEGLLLNASVAPPLACERGRYNVTRQAYRYLLDRATDVPSIREMCAVTGASYATLERGFRETYGMTPKAMMTALRLSGARRGLLHPGPTTTVTAVAMRWGFVEFGRFALQYRQRYGEVPSETLRKARGEPPQNVRLQPQRRAFDWFDLPTLGTS